MTSAAGHPGTLHADPLLAEVELRRFSQTLSLLRIYNVYRILVGVALLVIHSQEWLQTELGRNEPRFFLWILLTYIAFNILILVLTRRLYAAARWQRFFAVLVVGVDIVWLSVLMSLSGGVGSGLDGFVLVTVTAGAIVLSRRASLLTAALATIMVLYQELYLTFAIPGEASDFFQAGVLGALFFTSTLVIQNVSNRLRQNELRNLEQAAELADLERINQLVIQRMHTGIVVVDEHDAVRTANQSARNLLGQPAEHASITLPAPILEGLRNWRQTRARTLPAVQLDAGGPSIRVSFSPVGLNDQMGFATIFIEDNGEIQQQAQQLKLSELGRLSASIAHEIRNPLAAISHAAQLLQESRNLDRGDERLIAIIHNHTRRMNAVVENVLLLSRRQPPNPERISLDWLLASFCKEFAEAEPGIVFETVIRPADTAIRADIRQIKQVLTNLVTNAQRHGGATATRIRFSGGIDAQTDRPFLNVIDNGSGIPEGQEKHLFEPFHTTLSKGTGLGLYLSREICAANHARLSYTRDEQGGACFRILFMHPDRLTA